MYLWRLSRVPPPPLSVFWPLNKWVLASSVNFNLFMDTRMLFAHSLLEPPDASMSSSSVCTLLSSHQHNVFAKWPTPFLFPLSHATCIFLSVNLIPSDMVSLVACLKLICRRLQSDGNEVAHRSMLSLSKMPASWRKAHTTNGNKYWATENASAGTDDIAIPQSDCDKTDFVVCWFDCNFCQMLLIFLLSFFHRLRSAARTTEWVLGIPFAVTSWPWLQTVCW